MIFEGRGQFGLGPFPDVSRLHLFLEQPNWNESHLVPSPYGTDPWRHGLPDDAPIRFVHGDLNSKNIMVTAEEVEPPECWQFLIGIRVAGIRLNGSTVRRGGLQCLEASERKMLLPGFCKARTKFTILGTISVCAMAHDALNGLEALS